MMVKRTKERIAFWLEQVVLIGVTVASIFYASRIGYEQATRFSAWRELQQTQLILLSARQELTLNRDALYSALQDWDSQAFTDLFVSTQAFNRVRDSDQYFHLASDTIERLSQAYAPSLQQVLESMQKQVGGPASRLYARILRHHLERMERAIPALDHELATQREKLEAYEISLSDSWVEWRSTNLEMNRTTPTSTTVSIKLSSSPDWSALRPHAYTGDLPVMNWTQASTVPRTSGPLIWSYSVSRSELGGADAAKIILVLSREAPLDMGETAAGDKLSELFSGRIEGVDAIVLSHPLAPSDSRRIEGEIVDPNPQFDWRWAYLLIEDSDGNRYPVSYLDGWRLGQGKAWQYWREPSENALTLPVGYLAGIN